MHVFRLWEEASAPWETPNRGRCSMQTAHRRAPGRQQVRTQDLLTVRHNITHCLYPHGFKILKKQLHKFLQFTSWSHSRLGGSVFFCISIWLVSKCHLTQALICVLFCFSFDQKKWKSPLSLYITVSLGRSVIISFFSLIPQLTLSYLNYSLM